MPTCVHFPACSGCRLPLDAKQPPGWERIAPFFPFSVQLFSQLPTEWRLKAKLAVRGKKGAPRIGLFRAATHEAMSIPHRLVQHPAINRAVRAIEEAMVQNAIEPYSEITHTGQLRYLQLFVCPATHKIQLVLVASDLSVERLAQALWRDFPFWHSIWINAQPSATNRILGEEWHLCFGPPFLFQKMGEATVAFHPGAFSQANLSLFDQLLEKVATWVAPGSRALEIYAGAGGISLHLAPRLASALLVEENPYAHLSYQHSHPPASFRYLASDAQAAIAYLNDADLLIVDPPRKGLDPSLLAAIQNTTDKSLIYISCSFDSFARDAEALGQAGFTMQDAAGYWLFPGTDHVELAVSFIKKR